MALLGFTLKFNNFVTTRSFNLHTEKSTTCLRLYLKNPKQEKILNFNTIQNQTATLHFPYGYCAEDDREKYMSNSRRTITCAAAENLISCGGYICRENEANVAIVHGCATKGCTAWNITESIATTR